jgi:hypothetical protein
MFIGSYRFGETNMSLRSLKLMLPSWNCYRSATGVNGSSETQCGRWTAFGAVTPQSLTLAVMATQRPLRSYGAGICIVDASGLGRSVCIEMRQHEDRVAGLADVTETMSLLSRGRAVEIGAIGIDKKADPILRKSEPPRCCRGLSESASCCHLARTSATHFQVR